MKNSFYEEIIEWVSLFNENTLSRAELIDYLQTILFFEKDLQLEMGMQGRDFELLDTIYDLLTKSYVRPAPAQNVRIQEKEYQWTDDEVKAMIAPLLDE